jgi:hypothetical protein
MKVYIGPYKRYISAYHIAEKLLFWKAKHSDAVYNFGNRLDNITWIKNLCAWINASRTRKISVRIDNYDTWNADDTLAHIILPTLKMLRDNKAGAPYVDNEDVPEHLYSPTETYDTDPMWFARWEYVLNEMIFAFENKLTAWTDESLSDSGPDEYDWNNAEIHANRIQNGFRLFGKYYQSLWT